jgi:hypothetical protein
MGNPPLLSPQSYFLSVKISELCIECIFPSSPSILLPHCSGISNRRKKTVNSGPYGLPATTKGSACTSIRPNLVRYNNISIVCPVILLSTVSVSLVLIFQILKLHVQCVQGLIWVDQQCFTFYLGNLKTKFFTLNVKESI